MKKCKIPGKILDFEESLISLLRKEILPKIKKLSYPYQQEFKITQHRSIRKKSLLRLHYSSSKRLVGNEIIKITFDNKNEEWYVIVSYGKVLNQNIKSNFEAKEFAIKEENIPAITNLIKNMLNALQLYNKKLRMNIGKNFRIIGEQYAKIAKVRKIIRDLELKNNPTINLVHKMNFNKIISEIQYYEE